MSLTRTDLIAAARQSIPDDNPQAEALAEALANSFAEVTEARINFAGVAADPNRIDYFTGDKLSGSGVTIKPGNVLLNWKKLFGDAPGLVLTGAGVNSLWLAPAAALYMCKLVWDLAHVTVSTDHAATMYALWEQGTGRRYSEGEALEIVNRHRSAQSLIPLQLEAFARIVDDLHKLKCIELRDGLLRLIESVRAPN